MTPVRRYVSPRSAVLLGAPALVVLLLPRPWPWLAVAAWTVVATLAILYDRTGAVGPADLDFVRELPVKLSIGVTNVVTMTVRNRSDMTARLVARETPPAGFEGERSLGRLVIPPRSEVTVTLRFTPPSRGLFRFGAPAFRSLGPYGLAGWQAEADIAEDAKVYPDITAVRRYELLARRGGLLEMGLKTVRYPGSGTEFESLRDYQPGDDFRDVDWKATARRGEPVTRRFEAERSQTIVLAIDAGRLMTPRVGSLTKLDRAVNAALLLGYLASRGDDFVGLLVFGREVVTYLPPRKGHKQFLTILEHLYKVEGRLEEPDYEGALRYLGKRLGKRSLIVLFTDLVGTEPSRRLLAVLRGLSPRHLPLVVTQRNREVEALGTAPVESESDAFRSAVAEELLRDKAEALKQLTARGSLVLDVHPEELSAATVNRYLEVKARGRL